ncbi:TetR family transcriptional regulator [Nocardioides perillae]|uniref:AcrR family transcriptional regulator n=1 Tax=Nocardioides perillae TaxID=1119534 RepID=A0A7Y9RUM7_9ACTN|nr:AcrR family transcriptional regulator [Nocardioides perillae]
MRQPLQHRSSASAEAMLGATLALLQDGGLGAVTVAAVAQRAGTSNGALYHRFGDRQGLLRAAQERALDAIEAETAAAFVAADAEPDDAVALRLLAGAALRIFTDHRPALRAFLVEAQGDTVLEQRSQVSVHRLATTVTGWLRSRAGASQEQAEASWRIIYAIAVSQSLFDDAQVSPAPLGTEALGDALAAAVGAIVRG